MPITVHLPEGIFSDESQDRIFAGLTKSILAINGATGNSFAHKHLIGDIQIIPKGKSYADGKPTPYANVTLRVPVFSLDTPEKRRQFTTQICDIIEKESGGKISRERIYVNCIFGDAFWGVEGVAYTNEELWSHAMSFAPKS